MRNNLKEYKEYIEERAINLADYIIENESTVRDAAKHFNVSKSTVHKDVSLRLKTINRCKYLKVKSILENNKAQRHIRGGFATREKYRKEK